MGEVRARWAAFMIAAPFKMFAIFIFVALLLLRKKNVLEIADSMVLVVLPKFLINKAFDSTSHAIISKMEFEEEIHRLPDSIPHFRHCS